MELTGTMFMSQVSVCSSSFVCPALQRLLEGKVLQAKQPCDRTQRKLTFHDLSGQPQTQQTTQDTNLNLTTEIPSYDMLDFFFFFI